MALKTGRPLLPIPTQRYKASNGREKPLRPGGHRVEESSARRRRPQTRRRGWRPSPTSAEPRGGAAWDEVGQDQHRGQRRGGAARGEARRRRQRAGHGGASQPMQALGARSPVSPPELRGGCGGGSAAVPAVVATRPRPQASRTRPEAGRAALLEHTERPARWAEGRRGPQAAVWGPK